MKRGKEKSGLKNVAAVILAGGLGLRIRKLYPSIPKPMIQVCGRPFLEWVIRRLVYQGIREFSLSLGYKADVVEDYFKSHPIAGLKILFVMENRALGTAGGFLHAAAMLLDKDYLVVSNGDSLVFADFSPAFKLLKDKRSDAVIFGRRISDASPYGSLDCGKKGKLLGFREKKVGEGLINAGVYVFPKRTLKAFPKKRPLSFEQDVFPEFLKRGMNISVIETDAPFIDIGRVETVINAEAFIRNGMADKYFYEGGLD